MNPSFYIKIDFQGFCRLWNLSLAVVGLLSLYNIIISFKSIYNPEDCGKNIIQVQPALPPPRNPCNQQKAYGSDSPFANLDLKLGHWDNSLSFKYFNNIIIGEKFTEVSEQYSVCLATQSSLEKLFSLVQVSLHWEGPISAAVFAAGDDELNLLLLYIVYLRSCYNEIKDRVNFHLVVPKTRMPKEVMLDMSNFARMDCSRPEETLQQLLKERTSASSKWRIKNPYPQNHLRNIARKNCQSDYVFLTDVDIIPSFHLAPELDKFLRQAKCKGLCAYVIPTYELDDRVRFPPNKTELVRLATKGLARPFHHKVFIYNQFATNFSK